MHIGIKLCCTYNMHTSARYFSEFQKFMLYIRYITIYVYTNLYIVIVLKYVEIHVVPVIAIRTSTLVLPARLNTAKAKDSDQHALG